MTPQLENQIYTKLADSFVTAWGDSVKEGNFERYDRVVGTQNPRKRNRADGDHPRANLFIRSGKDNLYTTDETFMTHAPEGPCGWSETSDTVFRLRLVTQKLSFDEFSVLVTKTKNGVRLQGPRLGLSFVTSVRLEWSVSEPDVDNPEEPQRHSLTLDIFVSTETSGKPLTEDVP